MASTPGVSPTGQSSGNSNSTDSALHGLDINQFLKLFIAEMQNQDPLNPMDNAGMLNQIGQMRQIGATDKLTGTLDSILLSQNLSSASGMMGQRVRGLADTGEYVLGQVQRVSVTDGKPVLHIGQYSVALGNVTDVLPAEPDAAAA
jgi:flagellar basal-body rod modification protein FlgD